MEVVSGDQNSGQVSVTSLRPCDRLHQSRLGKKGLSVLYPLRELPSYKTYLLKGDFFFVIDTRKSYRLGGSSNEILYFNPQNTSLAI